MGQHDTPGAPRPPKPAAAPAPPKPAAPPARAAAPSVNQAARIVRTKVDRFYGNQLVKAGETFTVQAGHFEPKTMAEVGAGTTDDIATKLRPRPPQPGSAPTTRRGVADADAARPTVIPAAPATSGPSVADDVDLTRDTTVVPAVPARSVI